MEREPEQIEQTSYITPAGIRFGALAWGRPGNRLALCLHGFPDTAWTWRHLGPQLAGAGWRVLAPFMRGYAPTAIPADGGYQIGALARDAIDAHIIAGGDERAVVIGHDWGATAAYTAAAVAPERFARVVALAVPPLAPVLGMLRSPAQLAGDLPVAVRQLRRSWYMAFQQLPRLSERSLPALIPRLWSAWSPGYDAREDVARVLSAIADPARRRAVLGYYRAVTRSGYRSPAYNAEQRHWAAVPRQPLLYLHGRLDGCIGADLVERISPHLPGSVELEIFERAGHFLQLEHPAEVAARILTFVGSDET